MNKERILALADDIEQMHHIESIFEELNDPMLTNCFNMGNYRFNCKAPACIAGHAVAKYQDQYYGESRDPHIIAREVLGLVQVDARMLFEPAMDLPEWEKIKPEHAAKVMRQFVETGIVDWSTP